MSDPMRPWREDGSATGRAAELVKHASEVQPRSMDVAHGWDEVLQRATTPRRQHWLVPAAGLAIAVGIALGYFIVRKEPVPSVPVMVATTGTQWEQRLDGSVQLQLGRVQSSRPVNLNLESPQVSIAARSCRFAAEVVTEGTRVTIFEGEAEVRSGDGEPRVLRAGETVLFAALPPIPQALEAEVTPSQACPDADPAKRAECLGGAAQRDGLEAEIALFELGRLQASSGDAAGAVQTWRNSLARFPEGVFSPEARLALLVTLTQQRRFGEAISVARDFEAAYADDPRKEDVDALRRQLEWRARPR